MPDIMKTILIIAFASLFSLQAVKAQQVYATRNGKISFYSFAPIEDIDAHNKNVGVVLRTSDNEIAFVALMDLFEFRRKKMQKDFQQDYLHTDEFPRATFTGKINEKIDLAKDGTYPVTVTGKLNIHGVEQTRTEQGTITVNGPLISIESRFQVRVKEFGVEIPRLLTQNIAEMVEVRVSATLSPAAEQMFRSEIK